MTRYVKIILERNLDINFNNCEIDGEICQLLDEDLKYDISLNMLFDNLPCIDEDLNMVLIIDIIEKKVINWDYNKTFRCFYHLDNKGSYQFLDENKKIINDIEYDYIPKELRLNDRTTDKDLYLSIDINGNIL